MAARTTTSRGMAAELAFLSRALKAPAVGGRPMGPSTTDPTPKAQVKRVQGPGESHEDARSLPRFQATTSRGNIPPAVHPQARTFLHK